MKFGYTILYVDDVKATLEFYGRAFGLKTRFLHESNQYGELETGTTALAFASNEMGAMNLPGGYVRVAADGQPLGFEIALVTDDVAAAFDRAVAAGAKAITPAKAKPWGQTVVYVRSAEGTIIELCTPIG
jgi:lactoylglutathione lyase